MMMSSSSSSSSSQLPPAQPKSVLRGHHAQVHVTSFVRGNQRLASGDAEGYVVLWDLTIMRPRAVWRAHTSAILGISSWGLDKIITHGRDNRLIVWKLTAHEEVALSGTLPLDTSSPPRPQPWMLHILEVNTMNFCSFASCSENPDGQSGGLLVAVPNTLASESVDIFQLPSQSRLDTVHPVDRSEKIGMVMSMAIFHLDGLLTLITAYENGLAMITQRGLSGAWNILYRAQSHTQPVLSLDVSPSRTYFLTSGADALIVKHPVPHPAKAPPVSREPPLSSLQQSTGNSGPRKGTSSLLSAALAAEPRPAHPRSLITAIEVATQPLKIVNTKHSGQQSLRIRSDEKIFATAGWDSRVRVYSAQTMREVAVLKWHQTGCYAVAFASLDHAEDATTTTDDGQKASGEGGTSDDGKENVANVVAPVLPKLVDLSVRDRRIKQAKEVHWLAAGSKDGKISLWDIY